MSDAVLELNGLTKSFRGRKILDDVSLTVHSGEFLVLYGPSGAGKTTLLNVISGLDRKFQGGVKLLGRELSGLSDTAISGLRGANIGFIFQEPFFLDRLSCLQNIALAGRFSGKKFSMEKAAVLLERLGMAELADQRPDRLSGGQRRRLAMARALIGDPQLLLCDEPTGNLDAALGEEILTMLVRLAAEGRTLIVATHDERVAKCAHRIFRLEHGSLIEGGPGA